MTNTYRQRLVFITDTDNGTGVCVHGHNHGTRSERHRHDRKRKRMEEKQITREAVRNWYADNAEIPFDWLMFEDKMPESMYELAREYETEHYTMSPYDDDPWYDYEDPREDYYNSWDDDDFEHYLPPSHPVQRMLDRSIQYADVGKSLGDILEEIMR